MPNLLPLLLAGALGYALGWWRRGQRKLDALLWWNAGWNAAMETGRNPLRKRVQYATLDEIAPKVLHEGERP